MMRRKDREMTEEFGWQVLDQCRYGVLATVEEDGSPYCMPVNIVCGNGRIFFHCAREGRRTQNLRRDPRVCLTAADEVQICPEALTTAYKSVVVRGLAQEVTGEEEKKTILELLCRRYAPDHMHLFEREMAALPVTAVWEIRPLEITAKQNKRRP